MNSRCVPLELFLVSVIHGLAATVSPVQDYCWRDFEGVIPFDAFPAGTDKQGKPMYIGQVLHEDNLVHGKIYANGKKLYYEWFTKELATTENVKIFCSHQPSKFEWYSTKAELVLGLTDKILIKGGQQKDFAIPYIARGITADGENSVGKVVCYTDNCYGMFTTYYGHQKEVKDFQLLTYNPKGDSGNPLIDTRGEITDSPLSDPPPRNVTTNVIQEPKCKQKIIINFYN